MYVIKIENTERKIYFVDDHSCKLMGDLNMSKIEDLRHVGSVLLLDEMHYFDLSIRRRLLEDELANLAIHPGKIISPMEAVAAFVYTKYPDADNLSAVNITKQGTVNYFNARFVEKKYVIQSFQGVVDLQLNTNCLEYLGIDSERLHEFDNFLQMPVGETTYEETILHLMNEMEDVNGISEERDTILRVADVEDSVWKDVTITNLVELRKTLKTSISQIDHNNTIIFIGALSNILNSHVDNRAAEIRGAAYSYKIQDELYGPLTENVNLHIYSFENYYIPLFRKNSTYQEYKKPKNIKLFHAGSFDFYLGDQHRKFSTPNFSASDQVQLIDVEISMDANHNLVITIGQDSYLHDLH